MRLKQCDRKCTSQIIQRIADSHLEYAKDKANAHVLWTSFRGVFERKEIASQLFLRKPLLTMKFNLTNDTLANHFLKFDNLSRELCSTGATLEENYIGYSDRLLTMPTEYDADILKCMRLWQRRMLI